LLLYYITDGLQFPTQARLLEKIEEAAHAGVDYIQLRERHLSTREVERLALPAVELVRRANSNSKVLVNSRTDVALAVGADGVHLRSDDVSASEVRAIWAKSAGRTDAVIAVSCHTLREVLSGEGHGADFVVYGPVFGKAGSMQSAIGVDELARVVNRGGPINTKVEAGQTLRMPVFALGGVTLENAQVCKKAGAAGIAAIRLFQENDVKQVVKALR
jgi:thiamine-phosphate pyrophosphorylase